MRCVALVSWPWPRPPISRGFSGGRSIATASNDCEDGAQSSGVVGVCPGGGGGCATAGGLGPSGGAGEPYSKGRGAVCGSGDLQLPLAHDGTPEGWHCQDVRSVELLV